MRTLQQLGSQLLLPLATKNQLRGIVSLGPRLSALPYSGEEERLLTNVAAQTSLALEDARLTERMIIEERRRQEIRTPRDHRTLRARGRSVGGHKTAG